MSCAVSAVAPSWPATLDELPSVIVDVQVILCVIGAGNTTRSSEHFGKKRDFAYD